MITIKQVLKNKNSQVWTVHPQATLREALKLMAEKEIGAVIVVDEAGKLVGIFSERDFARSAHAHDSVDLDDPVSKVMTGTVYYVSPDRTIDECMALMTQKRFRHVPVLENGHLVGIVSIGDVVKTIITDKDVTIQGLENFILGREYSG